VDMRGDEFAIGDRNRLRSAVVSDQKFMGTDAKLRTQACDQPRQRFGPCVRCDYDRELQWGAAFSAGGILRKRITIFSSIKQSALVMRRNRSRFILRYAGSLMPRT